MITGSSGFLAYHFRKEFEDYDIIGIDKRAISPTNVFDLNFRDMMGVDYVIHLAWRTNIPDCMRHPIESTHENIDMTIHLLELAREAGVKKFFFPSTASLYGNNKTPWNEEMRCEPIEPYSWQKLSCEYACQMYSKQYGLPTVIGRFFQIFGEHQREDTALSAFIRLKKEGKPITLTETTAQSSFKSGQRDFIYAGDVAKAVRLLLEADTEDGEIYNIATGKVRTMEEITNALKAKVEWIPRREYEVERHEGDISKLRDLGWKSKVDIIKWLKYV